MMEETYHWPMLAEKILQNAEKGTLEAQKAMESALAEFNRMEKSVYQAEKAEFLRWKKQWCKYFRDGQQIFNGLPILINRMTAVVATLKEDGLFKQAPEDLQNLLRNRKEGLEIIGRMLNRLDARRPLFEKEASAEIGHLEPLHVSNSILDCEEKDYDHTKFKSILHETVKKIGDHEKEIRDNNYRAIRHIRQKSEGLKQYLTTLLRDHLVPVADGLERGIWDEPALMESIDGDAPDPGLAAKWFGAYPICFYLLRHFLKQIGLYRFRVGRGARFNPELHMALGHETCPELEDGQVLEVVRSGWHYRNMLIRAAEVMVVRNERKKDNGQSS